MMRAMASIPSLPDSEVLEAFGLAPQPLERAASGLINRTWLVRSRDGRALVLQRVHPIFPAEVNEDIEAVTRHIAAKGLLTPRLVRTTSGALWLAHGGAVWRAMTRIEGVSRDALQTELQAAEAGRALARFHRAVSDLDYSFKSRRLGVHDTPRHLAALRTALEECRGHREHANVAPLAERVLRRAESLEPLPRCADRIVHGDPKISNIVFDAATDRALCLIDLDTLARMPVALELGDAMRSWCNPRAEDARDSGFRLPFFAAAVQGYAETAAGFLTPQEWAAIPLGTLTITVELAARFCADSLRESYFGWDDRRYESSSAHNQARTYSQLRLADELAAALPAMHAATARAFAGRT
jgi:Ser/Thr protein kinase RdoA (MazF antagonist)